IEERAYRPVRHEPRARSVLPVVGLEVGQREPKEGELVFDDHANLRGTKGEAPPRRRTAPLPSTARAAPALAAGMPPPPFCTAVAAGRPPGPATRAGMPGRCAGLSVPALSTILRPDDGV